MRENGNHALTSLSGRGTRMIQVSSLREISNLPPFSGGNSTSRRLSSLMRLMPWLENICSCMINSNKETCGTVGGTSGVYAAAK